MAYETKPNTGSMFSNKDKPDQRENGPTHSGTALINGVEYFMDAWVKTAESGKKWMSFSFKPKQKQPAPQQAKTNADHYNPDPQF